METYQQQFIESAIEQGVLSFGQFTLKSGRISPYFFNLGKFDSGKALAGLGRCFAELIVQKNLDFDMVYGPAYKGISLAVTTIVALSDLHDRDLPYAYHRKEKKMHGEGGSLVGAPLRGNILLIDDVITAGTAVRESIARIHVESDANVTGMVVALDREERGSGDLSAVQEIEQEFGFPVKGIVTLRMIMDYLAVNDKGADVLKEMMDYRERYGIR